MSQTRVEILHREPKLSAGMRRQVLADFYDSFDITFLNTQYPSDGTPFVYDEHRYSIKKTLDDDGGFHIVAKRIGADRTGEIVELRQEKMRNEFSYLRIRDGMIQESCFHTRSAINNIRRFFCLPPVVV